MSVTREVITPLYLSPHAHPPQPGALRCGIFDPRLAAGPIARPAAKAEDPVAAAAVGGRQRTNPRPARNLKLAKGPDASELSMPLDVVWCAEVPGGARIGMHK